MIEKLLVSGFTDILLKGMRVNTMYVLNKYNHNLYGLKLDVGYKNVF